MITVITYDGKQVSLPPGARCDPDVGIDLDYSVYPPTPLNTMVDSTRSPYWSESSGDPTVALSEIKEGDLLYVDCGRFIARWKRVWTLCRKEVMPD